MARPLQNFIDGKSPLIGATWLNFVDAFVNTLFASATTAAQALAALGFTAFGASWIGLANAAAALTALGATTVGTAVFTAVNAAAARTAIGAIGAGAITTSGLTESTATLLGRTTAGTGAVEEITVGTGLSLTAGTLTATGQLSLKTPILSTSGTAIAFTSIPSTVKRITVMLNGVSTNGASPIIIQIGPGTVEVTGYLSGASSQANGGGNAYQASTVGFVVSGGTAASDVLQGAVTLSLENSASNKWVASGAGNDSGIPGSWHGGGAKSLAGALTSLTVTTVNGTDAFDAGEININYE